jgi:hypothetical protein
MNLCFQRRHLVSHVLEILFIFPSNAKQMPHVSVA